MVGDGVRVGVLDGRGVLETVGDGPGVWVCRGVAVSVGGAVVSVTDVSATASVVMLVGLGSTATAVTTTVGKGVGVAEAQPANIKIRLPKRSGMMCVNLLDMM